MHGVVPAMRARPPPHQPERCTGVGRGVKVSRERCEQWCMRRLVLSMSLGNLFTYLTFSHPLTLTLTPSLSHSPTCVTMLIQKQRRCTSLFTPPRLHPSQLPHMMEPRRTTNTTSASHTLSAMADCVAGNNNSTRRGRRERDSRRGGGSGKEK